MNLSHWVVLHHCGMYYHKTYLSACVCTVGKISHYPLDEFVKLKVTELINSLESVNFKMTATVLNILVKHKNDSAHFTDTELKLGVAVVEHCLQHKL